MGVRPPHLTPGQHLDLATVDLVKRNRHQGAGPLLILIERGHWCAACRRHLTQITEQWTAFDELALNVVAVVHEPIFDASIRSYPFPLIADPNLEIAERFGLVHVDEHGMTTVRPSVLLVSDTGEILFSYVGDDSRDRPTVQALMLGLGTVVV